MNQDKDKKSKKEIEAMSISTAEFNKRFTKEEKETIEREKRYLRVLMDLKTKRKKIGLTQEELANRADLPRTTITKIESGNRNVTVDTLMNIASAMGKTLEIRLK